MEEGDLADSPTILKLYLEAFGLEPTLSQVQDTGSTGEYESGALPVAQGESSSTPVQQTYSSEIMRIA